MYIALDLETTGLDYEKEDIIQIGAIVFDETGKTYDTINSFVKTEKKIPEIISQITGIKDEEIKTAPEFAEIEPTLSNLLEKHILIGHNIDFDINFLKRYGIKTPKNHYDTLFLASAILFEEKSHSLEILCKNLKLKNLSSHNAFEDAKSAMKLFLHTKDSFKSLDKDLIEGIKKIAEKSSLAEKDFILELNKSKNKKLSKKKQIKKSTIQRPSRVFETRKVYETSNDYQRIIKDLTNRENTIISVPSKLFESLPDYPDHIKTLDLNNKYIDSKKLNAFLNRNSFEKYEASALIKILIWQYYKPKSPLSSLRLFNEEKKIIPKINNLEKTNKTHLDNNSTIICTHDFILDTEKAKKDIFLVDLNSFEKALVKKESTYLSIDLCLNPIENILSIHKENEELKQIIKRTTILFAICGLLFENHKERNSDFIDVQEKHLNSPHWAKIQGSINGLIKISKELINIKNDETVFELQRWKENLKILSDVFHKKDILTKTTTLIKLKDGSCGIKTEKNNLCEEKKRFFEKWENLSIIDQTISLNDNGKFYYNYHQIPKTFEYLEIENNKEKSSLHIIPTNDKNLEKKIIEIANQTKCPLVIIENSKTVIKRLTIELSKQLTKKDIISETTGSLGKIHEKLKETNKEAVLIISTGNYERLEKTEDLKTIILNKIPFIYQKDKSSNFLNETLPLTTIRMIRILTQDQDKIDGKRNIYLLDERMKSSNYGKTIIKMVDGSFNTFL